ncbi:MAG: MFS transporter [Chloroflexota bacterium]|nr:MFS transporter [Chloroflexota bacterium]
MTTNTRFETQATPVVSPLRIPDFRLLWLSMTSISLAVQFYAVALVWLVLELTGSGVALGALLTTAAIPRAISMLLTGALIDRYPPRRIMIISALFNGLLMSIIALLLGGGWMSLTAMFIIAPLTGLMDAVFYPSTTALVPRLVAREQLAPANAMMQTADTVANIIGPALGGIIIGQVGLLPGFVLNAALFFIGFLIICNLSRATDRHSTGESEAEQEPFAKAVVSGIRYALGKAPIRISLLMVAMLNFAAIGPIVVGGALLVERRFEADATMYGVMMGAFGVGSIAGGLIVSALGSVKRPGLMLVYTIFVLAAGLIGLGFASSFWVAFAICFVIGIFGAITNVNAVTWLQMKADAHMQGRVASLLVFSAVALDPFSNGIAGALAEIDLTLLFVAAGVLLAVGGVVALFNNTLREE